ncbi:MAG: NRDE family protein [Brachymonas sp.]
MCLIAIALHASERFPLIIAGNRDEFLARPTLPLDGWNSAQGTAILGGRDAQDGGTWMGFTPAGRFAMLTNVRNPQFKPPAQPISRGRLVVDWLDSTSDVQTWSQALDARQFNGFNLIVGDWQRQAFSYLSHPAFLEPDRPFAGMKYAQSAMKLVVSALPSASIQALSNAALDTPWPKSERLKNSLRQALELPSSQAISDEMLDALSNTQAAPNAELPATGVPLEWERALSSAFVSHPRLQPAYGTRTSWVAVLERSASTQSSGQLSLTEVTHSHTRDAPLIRQRSLPWPASK